MKQTYSIYPFLLFITVFVMAFLICFNTVSHLFINSLDFEVYELCDPIDGESEKEAEESEKDTDDKIRSNLKKKDSYTTKIIIKSCSKELLESLHYSEIVTPPPQLLLVPS